MSEAMQNGVFKHNNTIAPPDNAKVFDLFSLKHKTAIVTGGGTGIGFNVARGFAEAGANVALWYQSNERAIARAADIEKEYGVQCTLDSNSTDILRIHVYQML